MPDGVLAFWRSGHERGSSLWQLFGRRWRSSESQGESHLVPYASEKPPLDIRGLFFPLGNTIKRLRVRPACSDIDSEISLVHLAKPPAETVFSEFEIPEAISFPFSADQIMRTAAVSCPRRSLVWNCLAVAKRDSLMFRECQFSGVWMSGTAKKYFCKFTAPHLSPLLIPFVRWKH